MDVFEHARRRRKHAAAVITPLKANVVEACRYWEPHRRRDRPNTNATPLPTRRRNDAVARQREIFQKKLITDCNRAVAFEGRSIVFAIHAGALNGGWFL